MNKSEMFLHPFCFPELEQHLQNAEVQQITPDVTMLVGNLGLNFFLAPPSSNIYILRDGDLVFMLDSGIHPYYRRAMLDVLERHRRDGAKRLIFMVSQGHWDHSFNNDVILESGYDEIRFLLPEPEVPVIDSMGHWLSDFRAQAEFFEPDWRDWIAQIGQFEEYARQFDEYRDERLQPAWDAINDARNAPSFRNFKLALKLFAERVLFYRNRSLVEYADILPLSSRETRRFGDVDLAGWPVGRFFCHSRRGPQPGPRLRVRPPGQTDAGRGRDH